MPPIYLPYINIALDSFALLVSLIVFASCFGEFSGRNIKTRYFLFFLSSVIVSLIADMASWFGEGRPALSLMTVLSNTVASCFGQLAILFFMEYLRENLYESSRAATFILRLFRVLCALSVLFSVGNAFLGYSFAVNPQGHYHHTESLPMGIVYLLFPIFSFVAIILMTLLARSSTKVSRIAFLLYTLFPVAGVILDYTIHGLSLSYVGLTVSALVIYTSIYLKKKKIIESQQNALMLSQINPHFVYNTLSTIASMCDVSPTQAKNLTIDFSRYLRRNFSTLSYDGTIPFEEEIRHIECYVKIEKARFRERLNILYSIQCKDFELPPLSVQPLVENAIKHGVTKKAQGGLVKISTYETDRHYVIEVKDDGVGFDTEAVQHDGSSHIGLQNVRSRLQAMCHGELTVKSTPGVGTRVTIELPKKKGARS